MNTSPRTFKHRVSTLLLALLIFIAPSDSFADFLVASVTRKEAKEMGMSIQTETNGDAGIRVRIGFKKAGKLAELTEMELRFYEGDRQIVSAPLRISHPSPGSVSAEFSAMPARLANCVLCLWVRDEPLGGTIYALKVSDFIEAAPSQRPPSAK